MNRSFKWQSMPGLGLICIVVGTLLSYATIPLDCQPLGALRLSATIYSFFLAFPFIISVFRSPHSLFHAQNIVAISPLYWLLLDMVQGAYALEGITPADVATTFFSISIFSAFTWGASYLPTAGVPRFLRGGLQIDLSSRQVFYISLVAFTLAFLRFAIPSKFDVIEMISAFTRGRWGAAWSRGAIGGWDAFLDHFVYFGYVLPCLTVLLARRVGWRHRYTLIILTLTIIIGMLLSVGGGRRIIGVLVGSGMVVWFLSIERLRLRSLIGMGAAACLLLFFMQLMLLYRNDGLSKVLSGDFSERWSYTQHLHVDDNFLRVAQITQIIPEEHPYTTWKYPAWVACRPIPRVFWQGKPMDPGFDLANFLGKKGLSLSASTIGELYMSLGLLGCAMGGAIYGIIALSLVKILERYRRNDGALIVYGAGTLALFAGMRSGIDLVLMSYGIVGWFVIIAIRNGLFNQVGMALQNRR